MDYVQLTPDNQRENRFEVQAKLSLEDCHLVASYKLIGDFSNIILKEKDEKSVRKWDLWEETCFELFIKHPHKRWYVEFNISPTSAWNCFDMKGFRENSGEFNPVSSIEVATQRDEKSFELKAKIKLDQISKYSIKQFNKGEIAIGLTTITEDKNGEKTYWALKHSSPSLDFHDEKTFTKYKIS